MYTGIEHIIRTSSLPRATRVGGSGPWEGIPSPDLTPDEEPLHDNDHQSGASPYPYQYPPDNYALRGPLLAAIAGFARNIVSAYAERRLGYDQTTYDVVVEQIYARPNVLPGAMFYPQYARQATKDAERGY